MVNNSASKVMSDAKFYADYSRFIEETGQYESWEQSVDRVMNMHKTKYADKLSPELQVYLKDIQDAYSDKLFLGAQRALQFGGAQMLAKNAKVYNCVSSYVDRPEFFGEDSHEAANKTTA